VCIPMDLMDHHLVLGSVPALCRLQQEYYSHWDEVGSQSQEEAQHLHDDWSPPFFKGNSI
jgi:hypothetical protein